MGFTEESPEFKPQFAYLLCDSDQVYSTEIH